MPCVLNSMLHWLSVFLSTLFPTNCSVSRPARLCPAAYFQGTVLIIREPLILYPTSWLSLVIPYLILHTSYRDVSLGHSSMALFEPHSPRTISFASFEMSVGSGEKCCALWPHLLTNVLLWNAGGMERSYCNHLLIAEHKSASRGVSRTEFS